MFDLLRWVRIICDLDILLAIRGGRLVAPGDGGGEGLEVVLQEGFRIPARERNTFTPCASLQATIFLVVDQFEKQ